MWIRESLDGTSDALLLGLQRAFLSRCDADFDVILARLPTHLPNRASTVLAPHYWASPHREISTRPGTWSVDSAGGSTNAARHSLAVAARTAADRPPPNRRRRLDFEGIHQRTGLDNQQRPDFCTRITRSCWQ